MHGADDVVPAGDSGDGPTDRWFGVLEALPEPVFVCSSVRAEHGVIVDLRIDYLNPAAATLVTGDRSSVIGRTMLEAFPEHEGTWQFDRYLAVASTGRAESLHVPWFEVGAVEGAFDLSIAPFEDGIVIVARFAADHVSEVAELRQAATHDPLTGLANRALTLDELRLAMAASERSGRPTAVLLADLDNFKDVNDSLGHAVGDEFLQLAAQRMSQAVRSGDLLGRIGGDEFVVVMREVSDPLETQRVADRLLETFREPFRVGEAELWCTLSMGIALADATTATAEAIVRNADTALYQAKSTGRDQVVFYDDVLQSAADRRSRLERELNTALERGEFEVHFQPEVDLATGRTVAVEALLRWRRPTGDVIDAAEFLHVAEETGAIVPIGAWAIKVACEQLVQRLDAVRRAGDEQLTLRVNVSALQLAEGHLLDALEEALAVSGLDPARLTVEFDESALSRSTRQVRQNLERIRARGVRLVLDDFGHGATALSSITSIPFSMVKLDRSLLVDAGDQQLLRGIVALASHLGLPLVAEGVETLEQVSLLRELGCTGAQGYFFAPPGPPPAAPSEPTPGSPDATEGA